jgi:hypothetical protein
MFDEVALTADPLGRLGRARCSSSCALSIAAPPAASSSSSYGGRQRQVPADTTTMQRGCRHLGPQWPHERTRRTRPTGGGVGGRRKSTCATVVGAPLSMPFIDETKHWPPATRGGGPQISRVMLVDEQQDRRRALVERRGRTRQRASSSRARRRADDADDVRLAASAEAARTQVRGGCRWTAVLGLVTIALLHLTMGPSHCHTAGATAESAAGRLASGK